MVGLDRLQLRLDLRHHGREVGCRVPRVGDDAQRVVRGRARALALSHRRVGRYDVEMVVNGILGSLVAITAPCAVCTPLESIVIGAVGGYAAIAGNDAVAACGLDDPVGAVGVHGCSAVVGLLAVGVFADASLIVTGLEHDDGLLRGGGARLLGAQCAAVLVVVAWSVVTSWLSFLALRAHSGDLRVSADEEPPRHGHSRARPRPRRVVAAHS